MPPIYAEKHLRFYNDKLKKYVIADGFQKSKNGTMTNCSTTIGQMFLKPGLFPLL